MHKFNVSNREERSNEAVVLLPSISATCLLIFSLCVGQTPSALCRHVLAGTRPAQENWEVKRSKRRATLKKRLGLVKKLNVFQRQHLRKGTKKLIKIGSDVDAPVFDTAVHSENIFSAKPPKPLP